MLRTAVVSTPAGCAIATVRRVSGGRHLLESCVSVDATPVEQRTTIAGWLAAAGHSRGALSGVLDGADYELLQVETPDVLPAELKAAVRWRLKDAIDFPLEDAVVDVFDIPEPARRTGSKMIYAIAARRQSIEHQVSVMKTAARRLDVIDIPELALRNLAALLPEAAAGLALLWVDEKSAQVLVIKQSTLYLARRVQFVGDSIGAVDAIALELQRSMDYFESHYDLAPLGHLIIGPRDDLAARLGQSLAKETSLRIQSIDLKAALELAPGLDPSDRRSLLAIGAALRDDQREL
jgi:MSHA biogenesis protein MshI